LNWYLVDAEEAEGIVYVINGLEGYEPHLFYNLDERKIVIVNSEYYGAAKSAGGLGLAGVILEERGGYLIHGGCVAIEKDGRKNEGIIIIVSTGTGKTAQSHELTYSLRSTKVHSDDYMFIFFNGEPIAKATEK
jgi:Cdc6-like AAA superfamily ATPase